MTTKRYLALSCIVAFAGLLLAARDTRRQATITESTARETVVNGPIDYSWESGKITHFRGMHNYNIVDSFIGSVSDEWKIVGFDGVGTHEVALDVNIDVATGNGTFSGTSVIRPGDDVPGTWECSVSGRLTGWVGRGHAFGHGTGVFEGQQIMVWLSNGGHWDVRILDPAAE